MKSSKTQKRIRRHARVRAKISGTEAVPRVCVFRSNRNIFVQAINDETGRTMFSNKIVAAGKSKTKENKTIVSAKLGTDFAEILKKAGITKIVFDRGGYQYHGRVKAVAEGLRQGGIKF